MCAKNASLAAMANLAKIKPGCYIAIANLLGVTSKIKDFIGPEPAIFWFRAEVKKVVSFEGNKAVVKVFFSKNDRDNAKLWVLTEEMFCASIPKDRIVAGTKAKACAYGWQWCAKNTKQKTIERLMSKEDMMEFIRTVEDNPKLTFTEFSYNLLVIRFWDSLKVVEVGRDPVHVPLTNASQNQPFVLPGSRVEPIEVVESPPPKEPSVPTVSTVPSNKRKASEEVMEAFREFKKAMNNKVFTLENEFNSLKKMFEECQSKLSSVTASQEVTAKRGVKAMRHNVLDYVMPDKLSAVDCARLKIFEKLVNGGVTTFVRKVMDNDNNFKEHRITRCVRQLKESPDGVGPACLSKKLDTHFDYYINHDADMLPIAILEIEPEIANMTLIEATKRWKYYSVCKACTNHTALKYMPTGKYMNIAHLEHSPKIAECVWDTCVLCMHRKKKHVIESIPVCDECYLVASRDGNVEGGDNRLMFLIPITYRFPWTKFNSLDWAQLCTARGEKLTMEGPDCLFNVFVPMLDRNILVMNEEDGGKGHNTYKVQPEVTRMETLIKVGTKRSTDLLLITRTDPKAEFTAPDGRNFKPSFAVRMLVLRSWITWYIKSVLNGKKMPQAIVLYLFYSHNNKHYLEAKRLAKKHKGRIMIGYAHTYPQETLERRDWRYCLTPNEGVLFQALSHGWQTNGLVMAPVSSAFQDDTCPI